MLFFEAIEESALSVEDGPDPRLPPLEPLRPRLLPLEPLRPLCVGGGAPVDSEKNVAGQNCDARIQEVRVFTQKLMHVRHGRARIAEARHGIVKPAMEP